MCSDVPSSLANCCRIAWNSEAKPIHPYIELIKSLMNWHKANWHKASV